MMMSSTARSFCVALLAIALIASFQPGALASSRSRHLLGPDHDECLKECKEAFNFGGFPDTKQCSAGAKIIVNFLDLPNSEKGKLTSSCAKVFSGSITGFCNKYVC